MSRKYDCSRTAEFCHEYERMCDYHSCDDCYAKDGKQCGLYGRACEIAEVDDEYIRIVQDWSDTHVEKTNLEVLKEFFPDARACCPCSILASDDMCPTDEVQCNECIERFWSSTYKDGRFRT